MTGVELIAQERDRQINKLGWTNKNDDSYTGGALAMAAVCYASPELLFTQSHQSNSVIFADPWPWDAQYDKRPTSGNMTLPNRSVSRAERIRQLSKAGALIAAEIDRLQRQESGLVK